MATVNGEPRSSLVTNPPDGRVPSLTPEARQRSEDPQALWNRFGQYDHPELAPLSERCLMSFGSSAGPPMIRRSQAVNATSWQCSFRLPGGMQCADGRSMEG